MGKDISDIKVYLINVDELFDDTINLNSTNEDWMIESYRQNNVYTIDEFVKSFNEHDTISILSDMIRIL